MNLNEAFKKLSLLNEEDFNISDKGVVDKLSSFVDDDIEAPVEEIIYDTEAESEEDTQDSYVGDLILSCEACHTNIYAKPEDIVVDEETGLVNIEQQCPICGSNAGYSIIGKVAEFDPELELEEAEPEVEEEDTEEYFDVEHPEEEFSDEDITEALNSVITEDIDSIELTSGSEKVSIDTEGDIDIHIEKESNPEDVNLEELGEEEAPMSDEEEIVPLSDEEIDGLLDINPEEEIDDEEVEEESEEDEDGLEEAFRKELQKKNKVPTKESLNHLSKKPKHLVEAKWGATLETGTALRKALNTEDYKKIVDALVKCLKEAIKKSPEEYKDDFESLLDDIKFSLYQDADFGELDTENADEETIDFYLDDFYDLCDAARLFVSLGEGLTKHGHHKSSLKEDIENWGKDYHQIINGLIKKVRGEYDALIPLLQKIDVKNPNDVKREDINAVSKYIYQDNMPSWIIDKIEPVLYDLKTCIYDESFRHKKHDKHLSEDNMFNPDKVYPLQISKSILKSLNNLTELSSNEANLYLKGAILASAANTDKNILEYISQDIDKEYGHASWLEDVLLDGGYDKYFTIVSKSPLKIKCHDKHLDRAFANLSNNPEVLNKFVNKFIKDCVNAAELEPEQIKKIMQESKRKLKGHKLTEGANANYTINAVIEDIKPYKYKSTPEGFIKSFEAFDYDTNEDEIGEVEFTCKQPIKLTVTSIDSYNWNTDNPLELSGKLYGGTCYVGASSEEAAKDYLGLMIDGAELTSTQICGYSHSDIDREVLTFESTSNDDIYELYIALDDESIKEFNNECHLAQNEVYNESLHKKNQYKFKESLAINHKIKHKSK